jgi:osmoprotectant transport system permease protein
MTIIWDWVPNNAELLAVTALDHLVLTLVAVGVGLVLSFALALLIVRDPRSSGPILGIAGILYTIPSLALFALLVPITGLTALTAEIGLISYTLLILIRNIVAGFDSVAPDIREAADAMGYTPFGRLLRVELPLAVPLIVAGLRIATVTTIGLVMVTALIGEGGLGQLTLRGFNLQNWAEVYSSSIVTVLLAVVADGALVIGGRLGTPWSRGL